MLGEGCPGRKNLVDRDVESTAPWGSASSSLVPVKKLVMLGQDLRLESPSHKRWPSLSRKLERSESRKEPQKELSRVGRGLSGGFRRIPQAAARVGVGWGVLHPQSQARGGWKIFTFIFQNFPLWCSGNASN